MGKESSDGWAPPRQTEQEGPEVWLLPDVPDTSANRGILSHSNPHALQRRQLKCPHGWTFGWLTNSRRYTYSSSPVKAAPYCLSRVRPPLPQSPPGVLSQVTAELKNTGKVKVTQLCPSLCDPMDYAVHGILQARILEWVPFSRGYSQSRDWTQVSCITGRFFTNWAT